MALPPGQIATFPPVIVGFVGIGFTVTVTPAEFTLGQLLAVQIAV
jgi:hypothetical protein